jgi:D-2-hydroxyacid dehydrogenase (NADP+)
MAIDTLIYGRDAGFFATGFAPHFPELRCYATHDRADAVAHAADCEILIIRTDEVFADLVGAMPRLRLIQALTTGTDHITALPNLPPDVVIAAARGFHGPQMTELAFLFMLALARRIPTIIDDQRSKVWQRRPQRIIAGKTVVIVGIGGIAEELAKRCRAFDMTVIGVSSSRTSAPGFDAIYSRARLADAATLADVLIVLAPYTPENHHLIDGNVLDAMRPSSVLINIARGGVIDEDALCRALAQGRIAGAGLDVFQREPLPADSPLWHLPNVILTPHIGGYSEEYAEQVLPILVENLRTYLAGTPERMKYLVKS